MNGYLAMIIVGARHIRINGIEIRVGVLMYILSHQVLGVFLGCLSEIK